MMRAPRQTRSPSDMLRKEYQSTVINERLLREALTSADENERESDRGTVTKDRDNPTISATAAATSEFVTLVTNATSLRLSFRGLKSIDNLAGFRSLTKLCLDNNGITDIQNLNCLGGTLTWLDLSFNEIERMDGLNKLVHLTDLSLFGNRIANVRGIDECKKLKILSIGNNCIGSLSSSAEEKEFDLCRYLMRFGHLKAINLQGNPVCSAEPEYKSIFLRFLPKLKYLDYILVQEKDLTRAMELHAAIVVDGSTTDSDNVASQNGMEEKPKKVMQTLDDDTDLTAAQKIMSDMFNICAAGGTDAEEATEKASTKVDELARVFFNRVLEENAKMSVVVEQLEEKISRSRSNGATESLSLIDEFTSAISAKQDISTIRSDLMKVEVHQVQYFDELMTEFGRGIDTSRSNLLDLHNVSFDAVEAIVGELLTFVAAILVDQPIDSLQVCSLQKTSLDKLQRARDLIKHYVSNLYDKTVLHFRDEEYSRNRARMIEIVQVIDDLGRKGNDE